jgi:hypothetical protein
MGPKRLLLSAAIIIAVAPLHAQTTRRRAVTPRESPYERVLIPFMAELWEPPHAWYAEFWARNDGPDPLTIVHDGNCVEPRPAYPICPGPIPFPVGAITREFGVDGSKGLFLHVDRAKFHQLTYTLRVDDIYSPANPHPGFLQQPVNGTELPLVREDEFAQRIHLLNIPAGGGTAARKLVRIYAATAQPISVNLTLAAVEHSLETPLATLDVSLQAGRTVAAFDLAPAYAIVDLTNLIEANQERIPQARVTVDITARKEETFWAFATVIEDPLSRWINITSHQ